MAALTAPQRGKIITLPAPGPGMEYALVKKCSHCGKWGYYDFGCWEKHLSKRSLDRKPGKKRPCGNYQLSTDSRDADGGFIFSDIAILAFFVRDNLTNYFLLDNSVCCHMICCRDVFVIYYKISANDAIRGIRDFNYPVIGEGIVQLYIKYGFGWILLQFNNVRHVLSLGINLIFEFQVVELGVIMEVDCQNIYILFGVTKILAPVQNSVYLLLIANFLRAVIFLMLFIPEIIPPLSKVYNNFFKISAGAVAVL